MACINKAAFIYFQALGKALLSTALSMVREVVFGVGFALLLPRILGAERRSLVHACIGCADIFDFRCCLDLLYASGAVGKGLKVQKIFTQFSVLFQYDAL